MKNIPSDIDFFHFRYYDESNKVISRGGMTIAYRVNPDNSITYARSMCHPMDNFNKAQGRVKAAGRVLSKRARKYEGTPGQLLAAIEQDLEAYNALGQHSDYGLTLQRHYNKRSKGATKYALGLQAPDA